MGARDLGLDPLGIEHDETVCATREAAGLPTLHADVAALDPRDFAPCDGIMASAPCPPFSRAGKRLGILDLPQVYEVTRDLAVGYGRRERVRLLRDNRSLLVIEPWRWVLALRPRWVALEQVEDVLPYWRYLCDGFQALGYSTWAGILNAADYGVPQTRKRAILLASLDREVRPPTPTHADPRKGIPLHEEPWVSMAEALAWDGEVVSGQTVGGKGRATRDASEPAFTVISRTDLVKRPARTVCGNRCPRWAYDLPSPAFTTTPRCEKGVLVYGEWRYRNGNRERATERKPDEPAPTVHFGHNANKVMWVAERPATTVQATDRIGRPRHKDRDQGEAQFAHNAVPVSLEEAAILQDFPPGYPFQGHKTARLSPIGNAVPRGLARAYLAQVAGPEANKEAA